MQNLKGGRFIKRVAGGRSWAACPEREKRRRHNCQLISAFCAAAELPRRSGLSSCRPRWQITLPGQTSFASRRSSCKAARERSPFAAHAANYGPAHRERKHYVRPAPRRNPAHWLPAGEQAITEEQM